MKLTSEQIKQIAIDKEDKSDLFNAVHLYSHRVNVSLKQAYNSIISQVCIEFKGYKPYKNYESFRNAFYRHS
jgi:hypothetical protein